MPARAGGETSVAVAVALALAVALARLGAAVGCGLRQLELVLDGAALVRVLEALLEDGDGLAGAAGEPQRVAEVEQGVGARVGRGHRAVLDGMAEDVDRRVVVALRDEVVPLQREPALVGRGGLLLRLRL